LDGRVELRDERAGDAAAIDRVTRAAFAEAAHTSGTEHLIVAALRTADALTVSVVATQDGAIVGHGAASSVSVDDGAGGWFGLGPVSVAPGHQRRGIGSRLVRSVLDRLRAQGARGCVVLGDPAFYSRFGFHPVVGLVLEEVPPEYFLALPFDSHVPSGHVRYHRAFDVSADS
jgi:putative acetyltransferase